MKEDQPGRRDYIEHISFSFVVISKYLSFSIPGFHSPPNSVPYILLIPLLQNANTQFCQSKASNQTGAQREAMLKDLAAGFDGFMELKGNLEEGTKVCTCAERLSWVEMLGFSIKNFP